MITLPKYDLEKLVNDLASINGGKKIELRFIVRTFPQAPSNFPEPVTMLEAETGITTTQWVGGKNPDELLANVKSHLQSVHFQFATATTKLAGKRARDRVRLAAALFREILPDEASYPLSAYTDGDFIFCAEVRREEVKKIEEALQKHGWALTKKQPNHDGHGGEIKGTGGEHWTMKPRGDMKLPENQDRACFAAKIAPIATAWKIANRNGRDPFEFWFDEFSG
jgi:hypothetical protein